MKDYIKSNLKLLFPLNPGVCMIVHLNLSKAHSSKIHVSERSIQRAELDKINSLILNSSDNLIFGLRQEDLKVC